jgi:plasmid stability protein
MRNRAFPQQARPRVESSTHLRSRMARWMLAALVGTSVPVLMVAARADAPARTTSAAAPVPEARQALPGPEHISPNVRAELKARMGRHGNTMSNLVRALVLLDRPTIRALAGRIADEEVVARVEAAPRGGKKLDLPPLYIAEQDRLRTVAQQLAAATLEPDHDADLVLADRFATLAHTCVACHSVYLHGHPGDPGTGARH